jgi:hypothetical protein
MHIPTNVVSLNPTHSEVYSIQHYVIKFVSYLWQVGGFFVVSSTNKTDRYNITEILLKVALNTITQNLKNIDQIKIYTRINEAMLHTLFSLQDRNKKLVYCEWVCEWLLWTIFHIWMRWCLVCTRPTHLVE